MSSKNIQEVTREKPCPHCGKTDWCYWLGDLLTVCKRNQDPAPGWYVTKKKDKEGTFYFAPMIEKKSPRPSQKRVWQYFSRDGKPLVRVVRIDPKKMIWQEYWLEDPQLAKFRTEECWVKLSPQDLAQGKCTQAEFDLFTELKDQLREQIPIYRYEQVMSAIANNETIFIVEGEPVADLLWEIGIPATTNIGGSKKWKASDTKDLKGAKVVLCPDRDLPGIEHAERIAQDFPSAQWLYAYSDSPVWNNLPKSNGLDLADWIKDYNLTKEDILNSVEEKRSFEKVKSQKSKEPQILSKVNNNNENSSSLDLDDLEIELHYTQQCVEALYSETRWISLQGKLYYWTGKYYQPALEGKERKRISDWCYSTAVKTKSGWKYAYATATHVDNIWRWLHSYFSYPLESINPNGINCLNGVIKIHWQGKKAHWELIPHNPDVVYTYISEVEYDPNADPTQCDRLLSCLDAPQQKLFLQTIAAALDLNTIRAFRGREVKALICKGDGNNGKDTLREAVRMLFAHSMTNATVGDFATYDGGRKFSLAKLESAKINWSSENSSFNNLDRLQSLKAAITGEPLDMERKGIDEHEMMLKSVFIFNINESPDLKAGLEAIQSRWAVLSFDKTYKINADQEKGEIEADSRFRYDPQFLKTEVCPALLNKILAALSTLAIEGIDYSCTISALKEIQEESNHLWSFANHIGLEESNSQARVYVNDLWELLFKWYVNNGTLQIMRENGKEKTIWYDQVRKDDKNVKSPNQIYPRLRELFPKIKRYINYDYSQDSKRQGEFYLTGLKFNENSLFNHQANSFFNPVSVGKTTGKVITSNLEQTKQMISDLTQIQQQELIKWLNSVNSEQLTVNSNHVVSQEKDSLMTNHNSLNNQEQSMIYLAENKDWGNLNNLPELNHRKKELVTGQDLLLSDLKNGDLVTLSRNEKSHDLGEVIAVTRNLITVKWMNDQMPKQYRTHELNLVTNRETNLITIDNEQLTVDN